MPKLPAYVVEALAEKVYARVSAKIKNIIEEMKIQPEVQAKIKNIKNQPRYVELQATFTRLRAIREERKRLEKEEEAVFESTGIQNRYGPPADKVKEELDEMMKDGLKQIFPAIPTINDIKVRVFMEGNTKINEEEFINNLVKEFTE